MESFSYFLFFSSFVIAAFILLLTFYLIRYAAVVVQPEEVVLLLSHGRCREDIYTSGIHFRPYLWIPGHRIIRISRQLEHQCFRDIQVNDAVGTTLRIDIWMDYKVSNARKSMFAIESWRTALNQLVPDVLMTQTGRVRLENLLSDRESIAESVFEGVRTEALKWGVSIASLFIQDVRVLPDISRQLSSLVAAQIEMKKSHLEEEGRIKIQVLDAQTEVRVAELQARAKSMHPIGVARAYSKMADHPGLLERFQELYQLSLLPSGRVVSFVGFEGSEIGPLDAMMIPVEDNAANHMAQVSNYSR
ncbi:SPFH domain-containing protein [Glaciimonas sp. CA11.2]|uniref:SPFH domain-containing protein n=1 Tax=Glaciimonas sp. CA11.2 TaxID=3048601 RepID=UPI002AB4EA42|nr:SPFH domain-containing protein [Glaciimonas sp. CA11.2]MDY7548980.1 SPFH domain-containing protein [Glaciimonas sp. CA11.2]MEB0163580.1 SPFH domain-containing protein [Glaciimonas sp. CA11.2]